MTEELQPASPAETKPENAPEELLQSDDLKQIVETLLFITDRPVKPSRLADVIENTDARHVREIILALKDEYSARGSAVQIVEIGGGFQMCTKPEYGRWVRRLYNEKMTTRLSNAADVMWWAFPIGEAAACVAAVFLMRRIYRLRVVPMQEWGRPNRSV